MKIIITENKLFDNFQKLIDRELSKLKSRYRSEEISASNWFLSIFSKIDSVKVTDIKTIPDLSVYINVYGDSRLEDDERIVLYGDEDGDDRLMDYRKNSKELYYNRTLSNFYGKVLPHPLWYVNGKYYVYDTFKELFPDVQVNRVTSANMS